MIDNVGKSLGVLDLESALKMADDANLDLVEINPNADPPVCKIMDYSKFKYDKIKKEKEAKKHQHEIVIKNIQLRPNIKDHDLEIKLKHALEFLNKNYKVNFSIQYKGRDLEHKDKTGPELLNKILKYLSEKGKLEKDPVFENREIYFSIIPRKN